MKLSSKIQKCELSPIRKFAPYADAARARGVRIYPLNIGQPDIETPAEFFNAVREFKSPVLEYAPSAGVPVYLKAVHDYYTRIGLDLAPEDMLATSGGSEALDMTLACILDDGDELLTAEPFYPNYSTFTQLTGATIRPIPTFAEEGFRYAIRERIEQLMARVQEVRYLIARTVLGGRGGEETWSLCWGEGEVVGAGLAAVQLPRLCCILGAMHRGLLARPP